MRRRDALTLLATTSVLAEGACRTKDIGTMTPSPSPEKSRMPVLFLAHGAPVLMDDEGWVGELRGWAQALPRPKSVLMISAHWEKRPATYGATTTVPLYYDFYGFPDHYYEVKYPAPGAPAPGPERDPHERREGENRPDRLHDRRIHRAHLLLRIAVPSDCR